ncbi:MAG: NPCBM/NEW2 domain-containing protein [Fimbriimonas sp.]|nr:NPCBM/NEW2 domain-containing protein [Fimbriimonas sp.]
MVNSIFPKQVNRQACRILIIIAFGFAAQVSRSSDLQTVPIARCMPDSSTYSFHWWQDGYHKRSANGRKVLCFRGGTYAFAVDVESLEIVHIGALGKRAGIDVAARQGNEVLASLPSARLDMSFRYAGALYTFAGVHSIYDAAGEKKPGFDTVRLVEAGRFVQRFSIEELSFKDEQGRQFVGKARLVIVAKPKSAVLTLEVVPDKEGHMDDDVNVVDLAISGKSVHAKGFGKLDLGHIWWPAGEPVRASVNAHFGEDTTTEPIVEGRVVDGDELRARTVSEEGWTEVILPRPRFRSTGWSSYYPAEELDRLERYRISVENPSTAARDALIVFSRDHSSDGDTGFTPMIRDLAGNPTGIPVQLSKNWHRQEQRFKFDGGWFHGYISLRLPPRAKTTFEYSIAFGRWGGVSAVSHSQLSVLGYEKAPWQDWQQVAIGSWGENICYEPSRATRSMILDWRPTFVYNKTDPTHWLDYGWTNNVGGGDFLVYYDSLGQLRRTSQAKTYYRAHGPNLSDVEFHDKSDDGAISEAIRVRTGRTDDLQRTWHSFRYDVVKPAKFSRLAFYQFGADDYLWFATGKFAYGEEHGLTRMWTPQSGGNKYLVPPTPLSGRLPWISMHESHDIKKPEVNLSWANRGMVIRHWRARLGGRDVPSPYFASFGIDYWIQPVSNIELVPPPDIHELVPGDYVEADIETLILPQRADDYYGPNKELRIALESEGDTWNLVYRQALGNDLLVEAHHGTVMANVPTVVALDRNDGQADVTIRRGCGWIPVTFTGLKSAEGYVLYESKKGVLKSVDQSVHGRDFWQCDFDSMSGTYRRTYNLPAQGEMRLVLKQGEMPDAPARVAGTPTVRPFGNVGPTAKLEMASVLPGVAIRYTLDGTDPTSKSSLYVSPVPVTVRDHVTVRARLFKDGLRPGPIFEEHLFNASKAPPRPPVPPRPPDPDVYLDSLTPALKRIPGIDSHHFRSDLAVNIGAYGQKFTRGIGTQGASEVDFAIPAGSHRFVAIVGLNDTEFKHPSMTSLHFLVYADDQLLAKSPLMEVQPPDHQRFAFDLSIPAGARVLRLVTDDDGDGPEFDYGDWANAGFIVNRSGSMHR